MARFREIIARAHEEREQRRRKATPPVADPAWFVPFAPGREKAEGFGRAAFVRVVDVPQALSELVDVFTETGA